MARRLSIILPSFNDPRISEAIESVRRFDDVDIVKLVVIDGGSRPEVVSLIRGLLRPDDYFVSEKDQGIFDGLNKGLEAVDTDYMGWLGSDDIFSGAVKASDVVAALETGELFVAATALFSGDRVKRINYGWGAARGLTRFGLHNPHFSTFGRSALLKSERFLLTSKGCADIDYFLRIMAKDPSVASTLKVSTLMREGGFSTLSFAHNLKINLGNYGSYRRFNGPILAAVAIALKLGSKVMGLVRCRLRPVKVSSLVTS